MEAEEEFEGGVRWLNCATQRLVVSLGAGQVDEVDSGYSGHGGLVV